MPSPPSEVVRLIERLERNADLHPEYVWAMDHRDAAATLRKLAGLPPRREPKKKGGRNATTTGG